MNKLECIRSFQEAKLLRKDKKKSVRTLRLKPEGISEEGNGIPKWLNEKQVSKMTSIALSTLRNWRHRGVGFSYCKAGPGGRMVRYLLDDVIRVMNERKINPRE